MLTFDEAFKEFTDCDAGSNLEAIHRNRETLKALGIDPDGDDTAFGAEFVYCGGHRKAHSTGWCTVRLVLKRPLNAKTKDEAEAEVSALGYPVGTY